METAPTAVFKKVPEGYIGFVEELAGANTQGATLEEARENLREAVELVLEVNRALARQEAGEGDVIRERLKIATGVKRRDLVRHLEANGCELLREGSRHSVYVNRSTRKASAKPRHREPERPREEERDRDLTDLAGAWRPHPYSLLTPRGLTGVGQPVDSSYAPSGTHLRRTVPEEKVRVSTGLSLTLF